LDRKRVSSRGCSTGSGSKNRRGEECSALHMDSAREYHKLNRGEPVPNPRADGHVFRTESPPKPDVARPTWPTPG
jgi:hypothetical protein